MVNVVNKKTALDQGIWIAEAGKGEFYSPGEIFIKAKKNKASGVPRFLGERDIPGGKELMELIDKVSQAMIKSLGCKRVYVACLCEGGGGIHFRVLPRYESDNGFLNQLDPEVDDRNDGFALMAKWRKQFLLKRRSRTFSEKDPFCELCNKHREAIDQVEKVLKKVGIRLKR